VGIVFAIGAGMLSMTKGNAQAATEQLRRGESKPYFLEEVNRKTFDA